MSEQPLASACAIQTAFGSWTPQAVVFDCDGLLLDTESIWQATQAEVIQERGAADALTAEDRERLHGSTIEDAATLIATRAAAPDSEVLAQLHEVFDRRLASGIAPMPGAVAVVEAAAAAVPIGCASNAWLEALRGKLSAAGILQHFATLQASDTVAQPKPAPDMYAAAVRALGFEPSEALAFEDSTTGARAARAAGLRLIAVPSSLGPAPEADLVLRTLEDPVLLEWITRW